MARRRQKMRREAFLESHPDLFALAGLNDEGVADTDDALPREAEDHTRPEQLRFISFGSGSAGNCAYIGSESCGVLLDAGVDNNRVEKALSINGIDPERICGILLTHDHSDHVRYAYALLRRHKHWKLYATPKALNGLLRRHSISRRINDFHNPIYKEFPFTVGSLRITPFETSHDGTDNAGYCIEGCGTTFVLATDTGIVTSRADYYIRQASHLMIEADYDADMLRRGPYPEHLKARIASDIGHLCNDDTARYVAEVATAGKLRTVFLCHLSQLNNTPETAIATVRAALEQAGIEIAPPFASSDAGGLRLSALPREEASPLTALASDT